MPRNVTLLLWQTLEARILQCEHAEFILNSRAVQQGIQTGRDEIDRSWIDHGLIMVDPIRQTKRMQGKV